MKILITGGSGFIGTKLTQALLEKGHYVLVLDLVPPRFEDPHVSFVQVDLAEEEPRVEAVQGVRAVFHLAGKNIFGRWNEQFKKELYESRIRSAENLIAAINKVTEKPSVFITASAVGYYGEKGEQELSEEAPAGNDFLSRLCKDWEATTHALSGKGVRVVAVRTAPVLGRGGMLELLVPLYQWGLGGPVGSGKQWFPWISIEDMVRLYIFCMEHEHVQGPVNAAVSEQLRQKEFAKTLGSVLGRPAFVPTPRWALRLRFGEFGQAMAESQKVSSQKAQHLGFRFGTPSLREALQKSCSTKP